MPSAERLPDVGLTNWHAMLPMNGALEVCFGCGDPMCETDYVEWTEFLPSDETPDPDPHWVTLCEGCSYAFDIGCTPDEFYMDGA